MLQRTIASVGLLLFLVLGSCFSPQFQDGQIACGPGDSCPEGLECYGGKCYATDPGIVIDARVDARPIDMLGMVALNVSKTGNGTGTVRTPTTGINCPGDCTEMYTSGTSVVLIAEPDATSTDF